MKAAERWLTACSLLKHAALEFLDASIALTMATSDSIETYPGSSGFENIVCEVQSRISLIELVDEYMHQSRSALRQLLNRSPTRVPINKLTVEILSQIFITNIAMSPCMNLAARGDTRSDIMLVCSKWYNIAVNTPLIWSHVDFSTDQWDRLRTFQGAQLWLERSRYAPLHIHVKGDTVGGSRFRSVPCPAEVPGFTEEMVSVLQNHVRNIASFTTLGFNLRSAPPALFTIKPESCWASLKHLVVSEFRIPHFGNQPLSFMKGLLQLEITGGIGYNHFDDVLTALSNCPDIHTLRLTHVEPRQVLPTSMPVSLPSLRLLKIDHHSVAILSLINTPLELDLRFCCRNDAENTHILGLECFIARNRVASLTLEDNFSFSGATRLLPRISNLLPRIRVLCIDEGESFSFPHREPQGHITSNIKTQFPDLVSLVFRRSMIKPEFVLELETVLSDQHLFRLSFLECSFLTVSDESSSYNPSDQGVPEIPEEMSVSLTKLTKHLVVRQEAPRVFRGVDPFIQEMMKVD
ncbi:pyrolysin [Ceratobasidium sp. AG-Ba]|nr:pyrolysin [Ceratobasidium sp. AG-Ba]